MTSQTPKRPLVKERPAPYVDQAEIASLKLQISDLKRTAARAVPRNRLGNTGVSEFGGLSSGAARDLGGGWRTGWAVARGRS